jgi:cellulose synthase/poly-beta-1,6-N-acetylglucosamine synthase-like glycosyltransferase
LSLTGQQILLSLSTILSILFFPYGLNFYVLMQKAQGYKLPKIEKWRKKPVTIQLPIFNEKYVVERLMKACVKIADQYGKDLVQILLLDDSADETTEIVKDIAERYKKLGYDVEVIHRFNREGFKAGALQNALKYTKHPFIAIFDADFVPPPDFLNKVMPYFEDEKLGIVQCRWTHLNRYYNATTKAIAIGYDGHHIVEQAGRTAGNFLLNFNGSAGVLRRGALEEAGGWQSDTLAEDLDASYRMQLKGWKAIYLRDVTCPAEIPPTVPAVKRQQSRWARGSIRVFRKLSLNILKNKMLSFEQKIEALIHLSYYSVHPLMFSAFLIALTSAILDIRLVNLTLFIEAMATPGGATPSIQGLNLIPYLQKLIDKTWDAIISMPHWIVLNVMIFFCAISMWIFYAYSLKLQGMKIKSQAKALGSLALIGFGISLSNTIAVLQGLFARNPGSFARTPKYRIEKITDTWRDKKYQISVNKMVILEVLLGLIGLTAIVKAVLDNNLGIIPILAVYVVSYFYIALLTKKEAAPTKGSD